MPTMPGGEQACRLMSIEAVSDGRIRRWLLAMLLLSLLGAADSSYLWWKHEGGGGAFCPAMGCDLVNQGEYAEVSGVPVAVLGLGGYLTLFCLSVMAAALGRRSVTGAIFAVSGIGVMASAFLVYLQVAVIKVICSWCVVSALTMSAIFVLSVGMLWRIRPLDGCDPARQERAV